MIQIRQILLFLVFSLLAFSLFSQQQKQGINWLKWEQASFDKAVKENKPIFLDVGTEWCTACNWMEEQTYTNKEVIEILNKEFINIKVDAEAQPDVGERYLDWGWPALIFMNAKGEQVLAIQGNRQPQNFIPTLKDIVAKAKAGQLVAGKVEDAAKQIGSLDSVLIYSTARLDRYFDVTYGGWTNGEKMPLYAPVEYAFWKSPTEPTFKDKAILTLNGHTKITDPVWGGIYFGSYSRDWLAGMPEKRSEQQAGALLNFSEAYLATGDKKWLDEALKIKKYLVDFLRSPNGMFYNSQEENISPAGNPGGITSEQYFAMTDAQRRKVGIPPVDKTIHTDINAKLARAFFVLYQANHNEEDLKTAMDITNGLNTSAKKVDGSFRQVAGNENPGEARIRQLDEEKTDIVYLHTQVYVGLSLLNAYYYTGDSSWLVQATELGGLMKKELWDKNKKAFAASNAPDVLVGGKSTKSFPFMDNAVAARFMVELGTLNYDDETRELGKQTILSLGDEKTIKAQERLLAEYLLAAEKAKKGHVTFSVVDPNLDPNSDLFKLSRDYYHPAKLNKLVKPGHYPDFGKPVLFVCSDNICSQPIEFGPNAKKEIDDFLVKIKKK